MQRFLRPRAAPTDAAAPPYACYRDMPDICAACEAHAPGIGPDPAPLLDRLASRSLIQDEGCNSAGLREAERRALAGLSD